MKIIYSDEELPYEYSCCGFDFKHNPITFLNDEYKNGIMLCGPTPRDDETESWRKSAIEYFKQFNFNGTIFIPERKDWSVKFEYLDQVEWELQVLESVCTVLFWVPRELEKMPAFTTNTEFGFMVRETDINMFYGRPDDAPKNRYLDFLYSKYRKNTIYNDLQSMIENICKVKDEN